MTSDRVRVSQRAFLGVSALLFVASAAVTIVWCSSMSAMGGMPMPGGWTMSMTWMRMPGQTWSAAAASFLGMWTVMMVAMMLPSLVPMLWRYRESVGSMGEMRGTRLGWLTMLVGIGYFFVWALIGTIAFPLGVALADIEMRQPALSRAVPIAAGVVVLIAGSLQFTAWKARHLASCSETTGHRDGNVDGHGLSQRHRHSHIHVRALPSGGAGISVGFGAAWRYGVRHGLHCMNCCAGLMAILLVAGVMDVGAMAVVTALMTIERLAPAKARVARAIGAVVVGAGVFIIAAALRLFLELA